MGSLARAASLPFCASLPAGALLRCRHAVTLRVSTDSSGNVRPAARVRRVVPESVASRAAHSASLRYGVSITICVSRSRAERAASFLMKSSRAGDGNNVCGSFLHAAGQFGFDFTFTGPETLEPEAAFIGFARDRGVRVTMERDPVLAVQGADLVVTDTWVSMHDPESAKERRHNQLRGYQVNEALMAHAKPDALFMHCLPAHRNDEATSAVMDGPIR